MPTFGNRGIPGMDAQALWADTHRVHNAPRMPRPWVKPPNADPQTWDLHQLTYDQPFDLSAESLWRVLVVAAMSSGPIRAINAVWGARAMFLHAHWDDPIKLAATDWGDRVLVLNLNGYCRFDEKGAWSLGIMTEQVLDWWDGDLRRALSMDREVEMQRICDLHGCGPTTYDIWVRHLEEGVR